MLDFAKVIGCLIVVSVISFLAYSLISMFEPPKENKNGTTVKRTEIYLENEEVHEVFIIDTDTAQITDHCDDCKYCKENEEE